MTKVYKSMDIVLEAKKISKSYGNENVFIEALKPSDIKIERGTFNVIIGKSGSGKSTLLHILGTLDRPTSGELYIDNDSVFDMNDNQISKIRRNKIGFVFQHYNLLQEHTVHENILIPLHLEGKEPEKEYFDDIIDTLQIRDKLIYYPSELSGGQQQRVAIARALISKPSIILADEPTGNLDSKTGEEVIELIKYTGKKYNQTIILVTHDMSIANLSDRIIEIKDGIIS